MTNYGRFKKNIFSKSLRDIKEYGFLYFILKVHRFFYHKLLKKFSKSIVSKKKSRDYFLFLGKKFEYLIHPYNLSWTNERTIEIPIIMDYIKSSDKKNILELGAVLTHYYPVDWDIVDKFETGKGITNIDIMDYQPKKKYDLIVSISTLEHVGFDDEYKPEKIIQAIEKLKKLLNKNGEIIVSMPLGYNHFMDKKISEDKLGFDEVFFLKRINRKNKWKEAKFNEIKKIKYNYPYNNANAIVIAKYKK